MNDNLIQGWRRYTIDVNKENFRLEGVLHAVWKTRELVAECVSYGRIEREESLGLIVTDDGEILTEAQGRAFRHLSNDNIDCRCGIYIAKDMLDLTEQGYDTLPIVAYVTGWGAYEEHELGWKVSHCRIEHLWIDTDTHWGRAAHRLLLKGLREELAEIYGIPCELGFNYVPACPCGRTEKHFNRRWKTRDDRAIRLCQMETGHIINAGKWLEKNYSTGIVETSMWYRAFKEELKYRSAKRDENGKLIVHF